jgi:hypothetical protein
MVLPSEDDILMTLDECGFRWVAWRRALAWAGPDPDEDTWFAILELELAADHWRDRFHAALARRGWTLDDVLASVA